MLLALQSNLTVLTSLAGKVIITISKTPQKLDELEKNWVPVS